MNFDICVVALKIHVSSDTYILLCDLNDGHIMTERGFTSVKVGRSLFFVTKIGYKIQL